MLSEHPYRLYRPLAVYELQRWGIEPTDENIQKEIQRIIERMGNAEAS